MSCRVLRVPSTLARSYRVDLVPPARTAPRGLEREAAAAARWNPVIAVGTVEHLVAVASAAVRIDDDEANTAWFLQVADRQILCAWDWADDATERVEVDLVPGTSPTPLSIAWTGKKSWELTTARTLGLINRWLDEGGSQERLHVLDGGEDAVFVLLTPDTRQAREERRLPRPDVPEMA